MANGTALLLNSLTTYYSKHHDHRRTLYSVVSGTSPLSLRVIDWFVTHYAKSHNIVYWINDEDHVITESPTSDIRFRKFNVYLDTRAQLKSYTKLHFDPFRRHERISFILETEPTLRVIETTVGQLNFFRWALQNHLLDYIQNHLAEIEEHMSSYQKKGKQQVSRQPHINTVMKASCCVRFD